MTAASVQVEPVSVAEADQIKRHLLPLPHEISIEHKVVLPAADVGIRSITTDNSAAQDAIGQLRKLFKDKADVDATGGRFEILIGVVDRDGTLDGIQIDNAHRLKALPNHDQAYLIEPAAENKLIVAALGDRGVHYGVATLCQLIEADFSRESVSIPLASILDWPDFDERGFWHMPVEQFPWLTSLKFNQFHCVANFSVDAERRIEPEMRTSFDDPPATGAQLSDAFAVARAHGAEIIPGIIHMDFWEPCCKGFADAWPDMVGKGERAKGGYFETKGYRVPCASNPQLKQTLIDLMTTLATRGASDIYVWMSEYSGGQCECEQCLAGNQYHTEARATLAAWQRVRQTHPDLKLRLFFGAGGFTPGKRWIPNYPPQAIDDILDEVPQDVRMCVSLGIKEKVLEDFVARGGRVTRCFIVTLRRWDRFCCQHIQNRIQNLHAQKMHGASQFTYGYFNDFRAALDLQVSALAEYTWNTHGRSIADFGAAWATRRGDKHAHAFGEWLALMSALVALTSSMEQFIWTGSWLDELAGDVDRDLDLDPIGDTIESCRTALEYAQYFEAKRLPLQTELTARAIAYESTISTDDAIQTARRAMDLASQFDWPEPHAQTVLLLCYCELEKAALDLLAHRRERKGQPAALDIFSQAMQQFLAALRTQTNAPGPDDALLSDRTAHIESRHQDILASPMKPGLL